MREKEETKWVPKWTEAVTIMTISKLIAECYNQKCNSLKFFFSRSLSRLMRAEIPRVGISSSSPFIWQQQQQFVIPGIAKKLTSMSIK